MSAMFCNADDTLDVALPFENQMLYGVDSKIIRESILMFWTPPFKKC